MEVIHATSRPSWLDPLTQDIHCSFLSHSNPRSHSLQTVGPGVEGAWSSPSLPLWEVSFHYVKPLGCEGLSVPPASLILANILFPYMGKQRLEARMISEVLQNFTASGSVAPWKGRANSSSIAFSMIHAALWFSLYPVLGSSLETSAKQLFFLGSKWPREGLFSPLCELCMIKRASFYIPE